MENVIRNFDEKFLIIFDAYLRNIPSSLKPCVISASVRISLWRDATWRSTFSDSVALEAGTYLLTTLAERLKLQSTALPLFLVVNNRGEVTFVKQGYTIHLGEQLLDAINQAP